MPEYKLIQKKKKKEPLGLRSKLCVKGAGVVWQREEEVADKRTSKDKQEQR
jgi:hypothetical protein